MSSRRDYKSVATGPRRQRARRHGLLVITLVLIGLFGGLLAYIKSDRTQPAPIAAAPIAPAQPSTTPAGPPTKALVAPVAEPPPVKPKYDFYTELPKRQIDVREPVNPRNAPPATPTRTQPATDPLRKPATPRKSVATPIMAVASSKPNVKLASTKPDVRPASPKPNVKLASPKPNVRPTNVRSTPGTTLARAMQPPRPPADNDSKIIVKTEREP